MVPAAVVELPHPEPPGPWRRPGRATVPTFTSLPSSSSSASWPAAHDLTLSPQLISCCPASPGGTWVAAGFLLKIKMGGSLPWASFGLVVYPSDEDRNEVPLLRFLHSSLGSVREAAGGHWVSRVVEKPSLARAGAVGRQVDAGTGLAFCFSDEELLVPKAYPL